MHSKGLAWAQRLRMELVERIEELRAALAGIEPLRVELDRLEAQLEGVDRLIAIYLNQAALDAADLPPVPVTQVTNRRAEHGPGIPEQVPSVSDAARDLARAVGATTARTVMKWRARSGALLLTARILAERLFARNTGRL